MCKTHKPELVIVSTPFVSETQSMKGIFGFDHSYIYNYIYIHICSIYVHKRMCIYIYIHIHCIFILIYIYILHIRFQRNAASGKNRATGLEPYGGASLENSNYAVLQSGHGHLVNLADLAVRPPLISDCP